MDKEFEKIILGGVETEIRSFESAMKICNSGKQLKKESEEEILHIVFSLIMFHY